MPIPEYIGQFYLYQPNIELKMSPSFTSRSPHTRFCSIILSNLSFQVVAHLCPSLNILVSFTCISLISSSKCLSHSPTDPPRPAFPLSFRPTPVFEWRHIYAHPQGILVSFACISPMLSSKCLPHSPPDHATLAFPLSFHPTSVFEWQHIYAHLRIYRSVLPVSAQYQAQNVSLIPLQIPPDLLFLYHSVQLQFLSGGISMPIPSYLAWFCLYQLNSRLKSTLPFAYRPPTNPFITSGPSFRVMALLHPSSGKSARFACIIPTPGSNCCLHSLFI